MTDIIICTTTTPLPIRRKFGPGLASRALPGHRSSFPSIMPKPDLTALTGGYRKTPVLQIGADIYCDSQLIMRELERRHPTPSFYPAGRGAADALAWWAEKTMFSPAVSIAFAKRPDALPKGFLEDRAKFSGRNIDPVAMMAAVPNLLDQLRAHFDWLDQTLADGRSFLQGRAVGLADLAAYHPVWYLQTEFRIGGGAARWLSKAAELGRARCRNRPRQAEPNDLRTSARCGRKRSRRSTQHPPTAKTRSAGSLGKSSASLRTIPDATRSSANWLPRASMRSSSGAAIPLSARSLCIFRVPALSSHRPSLTVSPAVAGRFTGGGKGAARSRYARRRRVCRRWRSTSLTACGRSRGAEMARYDDTFVDWFADAGRVRDLLHAHIRQRGGRRRRRTRADGRPGGL